MPRVPRRQQQTEAACYHVITRGHNRETLFADAADFRYFLELLGRYRDRFHWQLYHYCLMSNHVHLLVRLENPGALSRIVAPRSPSRTDIASFCRTQGGENDELHGPARLDGTRNGDILNSSTWTP